VSEEGNRQHWQEGEAAFFEYHCNRAHDSSDADLWYRSHQAVTVLGMSDEVEEDAIGWLVEERLGAGMPLAWSVRFADGHEGTAMDDELYVSASHFVPDGGPPPLAGIEEHDPACALWLREHPEAILAPPSS
jgi:hypothetical protein